MFALYVFAPMKKFDNCENKLSLSGKFPENKIHFFNSFGFKYLYLKVNYVINFCNSINKY